MRSHMTFLLLLTSFWGTHAAALDANEEAGADAPPAQFLVYSVTWQPTFCIMRPMTGGCDQVPQAFLTHGIWPYSASVGDRTNRHPQFCSTSPSCKGEACAMSESDMKHVLANEALRKLVTRDPEGMFAHEWRKHGTCSGKTVQRYFQDFVDLRKSVVIENPAKFDSMIGRATPFAKIRKVFPANTAFRCYRDHKGEQYLHEVFYLVDEGGHPYEQEKNLQIGVQCAEQDTRIPRGALRSGG